MHNVVIGFGEMISKYVTKPYKINAVVKPITNMPETLTRLDRGEAEVAWSSSAFIYNAQRQAVMYANYERKIPVQILFWGQNSFFHIISIDPNIKTLADLKGKTVAGSRVGSPDLDMIRVALLKANGLTDDDIKLLTFKGNTGWTSLKEGTADVAMTVNGYPSALVTELAAAKNIYFISLSDKEVAAVPEASGALPYTMPANIYKGQNSPVKGVGPATAMVCLPDLDEELAYQIVKAIFDHEEEFFSYHAAARNFPLKTATAIWVAPFHPGAIKYYKEKGIWNKEMDAKQKALLAVQGK